MSDQKEHINSADFKNYLAGSLSQSERDNFENAMEEGSFEKEALEGFSALENPAEAIAAIKSIEKTLAQKTGIRPERKLFFPLWKTMGIAASFALILLAGFLVNNFMKTTENLALNDSEIDPVISTEPEQLSTFEVEDSMVSELEESEDEIAQDILIPSELKKEKPNEFTDIPSLVAEQKSKEKTSAKVQNVNTPEQDDKASIRAKAESDSGVKATSSASSADFNTYQQEAAAMAVDREESLEELGNNSFFQVAKANYDAKEYDQAIKYFQSSVDGKDKIIESEYYIAMSYYNMRKPSKSIKHFDAVIANNGSLASNAKWYKAIILEEKGDTVEAKKLLEDLAKGNSGFKRQAQDKLNTLN